MPSRDVNQFITHWAAASPSERANSQAFLLELCDVLEVSRPDNHPNAGYFFEYPIVEKHADGTTSNGRVDLYKRGCFVLESKQFQEAKAEASQLELAAEEAGVIQKKKSSQPVRGTEAWDEAMIKARGQAERYVRAIPDDNPPFVIVVDVGHSFELFADFTQAGKAYLPFPEPRSFRIRLADLAHEKIRERLRLIWTNPSVLDPAKHSADVTREVSGHLAELAKSLEKAGHEPDVVAQFLTRCLFCMFAEDVALLPEHSFTELLDSVPADGNGFQEVLQTLFREMNTGTGKGISVVLRKKLLQFNGGLFADDTVLPINGMQLGLLKNAARQNWGNVEPAIFGTLLERALNPGERHKLGAHYTPRTYVERLVLPTVIEPLRADWENVRAAAITYARADDLKKARAEVNAFHEKLCRVTVLDPACGSGNFLYVALQHMKVLEGEVLDVAAQFGESFKLELTTHTIDPHQFLGLEINPRAAAITELVLWIGYLQWHFKLHGKRTPPEPILRAFKNIECRDAVLDYDEVREATWAMALENPDLPGLPDHAKQKIQAWQVMIERGEELDSSEKLRTGSQRVFVLLPDGSIRILELPRELANERITVWDRQSKKADLISGRFVPDETKRSPLLVYINPRITKWPDADFIIGNPPFIGNKRMREDLGDGYAETLRQVYPKISETADFVLYWWHKAAELVRSGGARRFGLITTNSLRQTFARRVVEAQLSAKPPLSLVFAIPDHPWVDTDDGASVRIAMTVGVAGDQIGEVYTVIEELSQDDGSEVVSFVSKQGKVSADLTVGANVASANSLKANEIICFQGMNLVGEGFRLHEHDVNRLGYDIKNLPPVIKIYQKGKELVQGGVSGYVIDCFGLSDEQVKSSFPAVYQHLLVHVKPERDHNNRPSRRKNWWLFGEPVGKLRAALEALPRYIVTIETSKFKPFVFINADVIPDHKLYAIASDDAMLAGVLSTRIHRIWATVAGGTLEDRPTWTNTTCFLPFPFPLCNEDGRNLIRKLAEELDAHRKRVQAQHKISLTGLYNVLEKIRAGEPLTEKEKGIHDKGLVSVLNQLHENLDAAVFAAYGWQDLVKFRKEAHRGSICDFKTGHVAQLFATPEQLKASIATFENELDAEILRRLVILNAERAAEEKRGIIHWLRPEYQARNRVAQSELVMGEGKKSQKSKVTKAKKAAKGEWPKILADRVQAVEAALHAIGTATTPAELAKQFKRAKPADVAEILVTLVTLGRAHRKGDQFTR